MSLCLFISLFNTCRVDIVDSVALLTIPENTQEFKTKKQKAVAGKVDDSWFEEGASEEPAKKGTIEPSTQAQVRCVVLFSIQTDFLVPYNRVQI